MNHRPDMTKPRAIGEILLVLFVFIFLSFFLFLLVVYGPEGFSLETLKFISSEEGQGQLLVKGLLFTPVNMLLTVLTVYILQRIRGEGLKELGLRKPKSWGWAFKFGLGFAVLLYLVSIAVLSLADYFGLEQNVQDFLFIKDSVWMFLFALTAISWLSAAFCEEIIFRGHFLRNLSVVFGETRIGQGLAVLGQAAIFAVLHLNQGTGGGLAVFVIALTLGVFFLKTGRNLWPLIIAHGLYDNGQFTLLYYFG